MNNISKLSTILANCRQTIKYIIYLPRSLTLTNQCELNVVVVDGHWKVMKYLIHQFISILLKKNLYVIWPNDWLVNDSMIWFLAYLAAVVVEMDIQSTPEKPWEGKFVVMMMMMILLVYKFHKICKYSSIKNDDDLIGS